MRITQKISQPWQHKPQQQNRNRLNKPNPKHLIVPPIRFLTHNKPSKPRSRLHISKPRYIPNNNNINEATNQIVHTIGS